VGDHSDGRPGGEVYGIVADATEEAGFTGSIMAYGRL